MFLVIFLAILVVLTALTSLLVRGRGRADWFPTNRPNSSLPHLGDGPAHHSGPADHGGGHLGDGHAGGGHGF